jgi:uncharacterized protein (TIGR02145 family)
MPAENLDYDFDGSDRSKCYYNDDTKCEEYGRLYIWSAAMSLPHECIWILSTSDAKCAISANHQGVCPSGWHIPSGKDWIALLKFANPSCSGDGWCEGAGTKLKSVTGWNPADDVLVDADAFGFAALPGGAGLINNSFGYAGTNGNWWSANEGSADNIAYAMSMSYNGNSTNWSTIGKHFMHSVRCLKDD